VPVLKKKTLLKILAAGLFCGFAMKGPKKRPNFLKEMFHPLCPMDLQICDKQTDIPKIFADLR
jgi:hypothetical protein